LIREKDRKQYMNENKAKKEMKRKEINTIQYNTIQQNEME
jgi:hypothetical protein